MHKLIQRRLTTLLIVSTLLALCLLLLPVPAAFATSSPRHASPVGPKQYYLALGDSLAFGYQAGSRLRSWLRR